MFGAFANRLSRRVIRRRAHLRRADGKRTANFTIPEAAEAIRKVGVASVVLSTDMGQVGIPLPVDGLAQFAAGPRAQGFTNGDLDRMLKENPARLLGLPVLPR